MQTPAHFLGEEPGWAQGGSPQEGPVQLSVLIPSTPETSAHREQPHGAHPTFLFPPASSGWGGRAPALTGSACSAQNPSPTLGWRALTTHSAPATRSPSAPNDQGPRRPLHTAGRGRGRAGLIGPGGGSQLRGLRAGRLGLAADPQLFPAPGDQAQEIPIPGSQWKA